MGNANSYKPLSPNYQLDPQYGHGITRQQVASQPDTGPAPELRPDGTSIVILAGGVIQANSVNVPAWSVYGSASISATTATWTKITYNISEFDHAGRFDSILNRYNVPVKGIYQINATIASAANATGYVWIALYKNGVLFKYGPAIPNSSIGPVLSASWTVELGAGEYIEIFGYQNSGGALIINNGSSQYSFSGYLIKQTA